MYRNYNYGLFRLIRPITKEYQLNKYGIPIIKNKLSVEQLANIDFITFANMNSVNDKNNKCILFFEYDKYIERVWNDPYKYIDNFKQFKIITTPDYSIYGEMAYPIILFNVFRNRYLGCFYQSFGIDVIPTICWANEDTYDVCFSGVEEGSIVCVSTIGCLKHKDKFLNGYNVMLEAIKPAAIIVKGQIIDGMKGNIINVPFHSTFNIKKKRGDTNGW